MVTRKVKIKRIENAAARRVTFSNRRCGLMKNARNLSVLCDAEVAVIVFSSEGNLFQFASTSIQSVLERLRRAYEKSGSIDDNSAPDDMECNRVAQLTEKVKTKQSNVIGENLKCLCLREVILLEQQTHESLGHIRARKEKLILDELEELKQEVAERQMTTIATASTCDSPTNSCSPRVAGRGNCENQVKCNDVSTLDADGTAAGIEDLKWPPGGAE